MKNITPRMFRRTLTTLALTSMLAVAQAIAVTIIGMRRVVWLSLIPVFSFPCLHVLSRTGNDPTPVDAAWLASNGSNPATFTADGLYLPGFRPNSLVGFGVRLMGNGRLRFLQRTCKIG